MVTSSSAPVRIQAAASNEASEPLMQYKGHDRSQGRTKEKYVQHVLKSGVEFQIYLLFYLGVKAKISISCSK